MFVGKQRQAVGISNGRIIKEFDDSYWIAASNPDEDSR